MRKFLLAGAAACCIGALPARADAIVNGDFGTGDLTGWTASGNVLVTDSAAYNALGGGLVFIGDTGTGYFAALGGYDGPINGVLSQTIATDVGQSYNLSFQYGAIGSNPQTQSIDVTIGDVLNETVNSATAGTDLSAALSDYTFSFTADSTATQVTFADASAVTVSVDGLLDDVSIPEPASIALLGAGLLGLSRTRRRARG